MPSPERVRWAKLRISVLAMSAFSILLVLIFLLSGGTWLKRKSYLNTYIPDSTGLEPGAEVQLNGVLIGKVESVRLTHSKDPHRVVEVRLQIQEDFRKYIPADSQTEIDSANMLGDKYIDILMGKSPQPVQAGGDLAYRAPSPMMQSIDMAQFDAQLKIIDQTIADIQAGKGALGLFFVNDDLYRQFLDGVNQVEKKLRAATGTETQLGQALYTASLHDDLSTTLRQLDDQLAQVQANSLMRDTAPYDSMRDQLTQVRQTLADLNAGKGAGGQFVTSDADYAAWNRQLAGWIESVDALSAGEGSLGQMVANAQTYESLNGSLQQFAKTVKNFREHPQKFLRLKLF